MGGHVFFQTGLLYKIQDTDIISSYPVAVDEMEAL